MTLPAISESRPAPDQGRMSFWGMLAQNRLYDAFTSVIFKSARRQFLVLGSLPVLWIVFANVGPIAQMVWISFLDSYPPQVGYDPQFTLGNWGSFFGDSVFLVPFFRTIAYSAIYTIATLIITYPVAYFLARHVRPSRQLLLLLLLLIPFWVGEIVRTFAIMMLLGNRGALNMFLMWIGAIEQPIPFMYTYFSLGVGIIYLTSLFMLLPLYSALEKLPRSYHEAAADLGAGAWKRFWKVTLPLTREGIATGCTLVFLMSTGYYAAPVLLGGPSTTMFAEVIGGFFHAAGDRWPVGAAFSSIMLITTLTLTGIFWMIMTPGRKQRTGQ